VLSVKKEEPSEASAHSDADADIDDDDDDDDDDEVSMHDILRSRSFTHCLQCTIVIFAMLAVLM